MSNLRLVHQHRAERLVVALHRYRDQGVHWPNDFVFDAIILKAEKLAEGICAENERDAQRLATGDMMGCGIESQDSEDARDDR